MIAANMPVAAIALLAVTAAGCSGEAADEDAAAGTPIACAVDGARDLAPGCTLERGGVEAAPVIVIRHPDGAFRRFEIVAEAPGIRVADGARQARVESREDGIVLRVDDDRYRLPAAVIDDAAQ